MIKFLLIIFFVFYVISKIGGFIMKTLFSGFANGQQNTGRNQQNQYRKDKKGDINIDFIPKESKSKTGKKNFPGGDYVDYEEVK